MFDTCGFGSVQLGQVDELFVLVLGQLESFHNITKKSFLSNYQRRKKASESTIYIAKDVRLFRFNE